MSFLNFINERPSATGITKIWDVVSGGYIGKVSWYGPWRKYCFYPNDNSLYDQTCLREVADFLETETRRHKDGRSSI